MVLSNPSLQKSSVKLDHFPKLREKRRKYLKPRPSHALSPQKHDLRLDLAIPQIQSLPQPINLPVPRCDLTENSPCHRFWFQKSGATWWFQPTLSNWIIFPRDVVEKNQEIVETSN